MVWEARGLWRRETHEILIAVDMGARSPTLDSNLVCWWRLVPARVLNTSRLWFSSPSAQHLNQRNGRFGGVWLRRYAF